MTISLCMIVKDEAERLPHCLDSVKDSIDEMIVVDTGSQDNTVAIAREWGAQVTTVEWTQNFAAARNISLTAASSDWILVLDADETVTAAGRSLLQHIRAGSPILDQPLESILSINLLRYEVDAVQAPYSEISRLFRNHADIQFERPYHETIDDSVQRLLTTAPQWQILAWPEVALTHTGYQATAIAQGDKFNRARRIMETYLVDHPDDAYISNKLGALYGSLGNWEKGRALLERALNLPADPSTRYELHYHLGLAYRETGLAAIAIDHYQKALQQPIAEPLKVGAYLNLGSLFQARRYFQGAVNHFEQAAKVAPDFALAHFNLGIARRALGDLNGAIAAYERAIALDPDYAQAHQNLGVALFKQNKIAESIQAFQRAIALYRQTNPPEAERLLQSIQSLGLQPSRLL